MGRSIVKEGKVMHLYTSRTLRELVEFAKENDIQKEDVVSILPGGEGYNFIYYYGGVN